MDSIQWGILSTAKIGVEKVIPALQKSQLGKVVAIASRSKDRAWEVADELSISTVYGSYEKLLDDPEIDAIYNPLPNHMHVPWTIKALKAGKHVLCEKPIGLSADEAKKLNQTAHKHSNLKVMEAFMYRFHPQWIKTKQLIEEGRIGQLQTIHSHFSYFNDDPDNIRNKPGIGGGGLMDIGCYNISLSRFLFSAEPKWVLSRIEFDPELSVDRLASAMLDFDNGIATFTCSTQLSPDQGVTIYGRSGHINIEIPFNVPPDKSAVIWLSEDDKRKKITFDPVDQYTLQADAFARAVIENTPVPTSLHDAVANMQVIDAIFDSAEKSRWVKIGD